MRMFYNVQPQDDTNPYEVICFLANQMLGIQILIESDFAYSQGMDIRLFSVSENDCRKFETILSSFSYNYKKFDLNDAYKKWKASSDNQKETLDDDFIDSDFIQVVGEYSFPEILETNNGTQILTEEEICRRDCIKIYTHSNENCGHHIPHVHVAYNDERNYCVISLNDKSVIEPKNCRRARIKKAVQLLSEHYDEAVKAWNRTTGHIRI